jgi:MFS family permease
MNVIRSTKESNRILYIASIVSSLVMLDSNVVAVALPTIARSIGADYSALQWIITAYVLPFSSLLLASGVWADLYGRKKAILAGQIIFALASLCCGVASSSMVLNVGRAF